MVSERARLQRRDDVSGVFSSARSGDHSPTQKNPRISVHFKRTLPFTL